MGNMWSNSLAVILCVFVSLTSLPGEVLENPTPDQLQFLLDLGGDGKNPEMEGHMNRATQYALEKHAHTQKSAFIAAAIEFLETFPDDPQRARDLKLLASPGPHPVDQLEQARRRLQASSANSQSTSRELMLATAQTVVHQLSESELESFLGLFADYHWQFLQSKNPRTEISVQKGKDGAAVLIAGMFLGGYLPEEYLLPQSFLQQGAAERTSATINEAEARSRMMRHRELAARSGLSRRITNAIRPDNDEESSPSERAQFLQKVNPNPPLTRSELLDCENNRCHGLIKEAYPGNLDVFGLFMAYHIGFAMTQSEPVASAGPEEWTQTKLPALKAKVLGVKEWLEFSQSNPVIEEVSESGETSYWVLGADMAKSAFNSAMEWGVVNPAIEAVLKGTNLPGWLKFVASSKAAPELLKLSLGTTEIAEAVASTTVFALEKGLRLVNKSMIVPPGMLVPQFARTISDFATKFDISLLSKYNGSAAQTAHNASLNAAGLAKVGGMTLMRRAFTRGFVMQAAIDMTVRLGSAYVKGDHQQRTEVAGQELVIGGREKIQLRGDSTDAERLRSAAVEAAWDEWKRNGIANTLGYATGAAVSIVASPLVFGLAAAAGAPTAGVGSVVVAVAGWAAVGAISTAASSAVNQAVSGIDDKVNLWKLDDRLSGIYADMKVNQGYTMDQSSQIVTAIVSAASARYLNRQDMKYMVFVDEFSRVEVLKEQGLSHFRLHIDHGNFVDSSRVDSWENYFLNTPERVGGWLVSQVTSLFTSSTPPQGVSSQESREAKIAHDFYDLAGNQAQWDDHTDKVETVGPMTTRGVVFAGVRGDKINIANNRLVADDEESAVRILSNGLVMAKDEKDRSRWVIKGKCADYDLYIRKEVGEGSGRYTCLNNSMRFVRSLNEVRSTPQVLPAADAAPVEATRSQERSILDGSLTLD